MNLDKNAHVAASFLGILLSLSFVTENVMCVAQSRAAEHYPIFGNFPDARFGEGGFRREKLSTNNVSIRQLSGCLLLLNRTLTCTHFESNSIIFVVQNITETLHYKIPSLNCGAHDILY